MATMKNTGTKNPEQKKSFGKRYRGDLNTAYDMGFANGWDNAYEFPKRFLSSLYASIGYKNGVKSRHKYDKFVKQYSKKGKQFSF